MERATFAAGCFWGVEYTFAKVKGVVSTRVGYIGGTMKSPCYEDVCSDDTGHAEAVEVVFDPHLVSFEDLLLVFWMCHDPTQMNRQGPDEGSQYRSAIFYHNENQKKLAEKSRDGWQRKIKAKVATQITKAGVFYPAEEYHQKYLMKKGAKVCR